ncbi:hypothetical protein HDU85_007041 [Gaertneriomyces sp. JEL0708]|nr:hypothetical protein HDU85_007041 [Gaertneriomyces sp. JEL0708]
MREWAQRWRVVASTRDLIFQAAALHGLQAFAGLLLTLTVAIHGGYYQKGEGFCLLNASQSQIGPRSACGIPIAWGVFNMVVSTMMCFINVRALRNYTPRPVRVLFAQAYACGFLLVFNIVIGFRLFKAIDVTCKTGKQFPQMYGDSCEHFFNHFGNNLTALKACAWILILTSIAWGYQGHQAWMEARSRSRARWWP